MVNKWCSISQQHSTFRSVECIGTIRTEKDEMGEGASIDEQGYLLLCIIIFMAYIISSFINLIIPTNDVMSRTFQ